MTRGADARDGLARLISGARRSGERGDEAVFVDELLDGLAATGDVPLAAWLVAFAGADVEREAALTDVLGRVASLLVTGGRVPVAHPEAEVWAAVVSAVDRLHGCAATALGRLPFVSDRLLQLLAAEARSGLADPAAERRAVIPPGRVLANVAVSRKLQSAVGDALGISVAPTYEAVYEYDPPGSHVGTHLDSRGYEIVFHLVVSHLSASGSGVSELVVHRPGEAEPERLALRTGDGVALRGRGTVHSWKPLGGDEHRLLLAVGFRSI